MNNIRRCSHCILSENFPRIRFDINGVCNFCNDELLYSTDPDEIEAARIEVGNLISTYKGKSEYDAILCYSGGKDSTFTLKLAVEKYNLKVLAFTLDNGFISPSAFKNIETVVNKLKVDLITYRPSYDFMKKLFRVSSLEPIYNPKTAARISANCNSCISIVNTTALKFAIEKRIPFILAGFTLGQIPSNSIYYINNYKFLADSRSAILDKLKVHLGDEVSRYMEISDSVISKCDSFPYNLNLLTLESITEIGIIDQILPMGWVQPKDVDGCSTNCRINAFNNFVHEKRFGYSPYELELSHLIRKGLLTREQGLQKIYDQPKDQIAYALSELGLDPVQIRSENSQ